MKVSLFFLAFVLFMAGLVLATYFNFTWFVELATDFINHAKASPVDSSLIAKDIVKFLFRGFVFAASIFVCTIPACVCAVFAMRTR